MRKKYDLKRLERAYEDWSLEENVMLSGEKAVTYEARKRAIRMYAEGQTGRVIEAVTGVKSQNITRMISRCYEKDEHGKEYGFRALQPRYAVNARIGRPSSMEALFLKYQTIFLKVLKTYFKGDDGFDRIQQKRFAFISVLRALKKAGLDDLSYPFTTRDLGRRSFYRFLSKIEKSTQNGLYLNRLSEESKQHIRATRHENSKLKIHPVRPLEKVEIDGHKIDGEFTITFTDLDGIERTVVTKRIWLVAAIDVATRAIVGCKISINEEYNRLDVLDTIRSITIPLPLQDGETPFLPNQILNRAKYMLPAMLSVDNALANLAEDVIDPCIALGMGVVIGPVAKPTGRPFIERVFRSLEENGFHRLPNTTGSNPNDPKRKDPERAALRGKISLSMCERLTHAVIRDYNHTPHEALKGFTPMEALKARLDRGILPNYISKDKAEEGFYVKDKRQVRSSIESGSTPAINIYSHRYTSFKLKQDFKMTGKTLLLYIDPRDISAIDAYTEDGTFYDTLTIKGVFQNRAISLRQMELLNKHKNQMMRTKNLMPSSTEETINDIKEEAKRSKKAATKYAQVQDLDEHVAATFESDASFERLQRMGLPRSGKVVPENRQFLIDLVSTNDEERGGESG